MLAALCGVFTALKPAEGERFELSVHLRALRFSRPAPSTTQPPLQYIHFVQIVARFLRIRKGGLVVAALASLAEKQKAVSVSPTQLPLLY